MPALNHLGAEGTLELIAKGDVSCVAVMRAYLNEIARRDPDIQAWAHLSPEQSLAAARVADQVPAGRRGPLHGLPVGVKDLFDTVDFPTERGSPAFRGRMAQSDAAAVRLLRQAGAIVIGKTHTTECGLMHPAPTRNPHRLSHTPGGSSSGSAAAVASFMAGLALGSQSNASTIRPASYCGVYGFKPSFGLIDCSGLAPIAETLDSVGVYSRDLPGLVRALYVLAGKDQRKHISDYSDRVWRVGFAKTPVWNRVERSTKAILEGFARHLEAYATVSLVELPESFLDAHEEHTIIQDYGIAKELYPAYAATPEKFSAELSATVLRGHSCSAARLDLALERQRQMIREMDATLDPFDVMITAAATGEAPPTLENTGDPVMSTIWSLTGTPALSIPQFAGPTGLPVGLQVVAGRNRDMNVLSFAAFIGGLAQGQRTSSLRFLFH